MPPLNGHTEHERKRPRSALRAASATTPPPRPGHPGRGVVPVVVPATVWAPPGYATGPGWAGWIRDTVRRSFLPPAGHWWDMTAALTDPLNGPSPAGPGPVPVPFWASLIDEPPPPLPAPPDTGGGLAPEPEAAPALDLTPAGPVASVDVVFADLTASGDRVDGRVGMIAARALRGGGILAVLTRCRRHPGPDGVLLDPTGAVVASAQNADLLYLQHIVIPADPLRASRPAAVDAAQHARLVGHSIAHADLLVFAQPRALRPLTQPVAEVTSPATTGTETSRARP